MPSRSSSCASSSCVSLRSSSTRPAWTARPPAPFFPNRGSAVPPRPPPGGPVSLHPQFDRPLPSADLPIGLRQLHAPARPLQLLRATPGAVARFHGRDLRGPGPDSGALLARPEDLHRGHYLHRLAWLTGARLAALFIAVDRAMLI